MSPLRTHSTVVALMPLRCTWLSESQALPVVWKTRVLDAPAAPKPASAQRASAPTAARATRCISAACVRGAVRVWPPCRYGRARGGAF